MATLALGIVIGLVMGLTGAGGGILAVPALVFALHWSVAEAGPVALVAMAIAAGIGAIEGLRRGLVRYRAALLMAVAGLLLSPLGLLAAAWLPERILLAGFGALMVFIAAKMLRDARHPQAQSHAVCHIDPATGRLHWTWQTAGVLAAVGATAGFLSGLLGVGGGFVIVPALKRYTDITMQGVVATSLALIALVSMGTIAIAASHGRPIALAVAAPFAAGAALGMGGGRLLARRLAAAQLQRGFARRVSGARLQQSFAVFAGCVALGMAVKAVHAIALAGAI